MAKKKNNISLDIRKRIVSSLNKSLIPVEYSYKVFKKLVRNTKKTAPLVYDEVENLIKSNLVPVGNNKKIFKKAYLLKLGDTITSNLIKKIPTIDEKELKKIVNNRTSQSFIDIK